MKRAIALTISLIFLAGCGVVTTKTEPIGTVEAPKAKEQSKIMQNKRILFVAVPDFRDGELVTPKNIFAQQGAEMHYASLKRGDFVGNEGTTVTAEYSLDEVDPKDFDAVIFIGGPGMTKELENKDLQALAKKSMEADNLTAAICIAPAMLGNAGLLSGKKATVFPTGRGYLIEGGAEYTARPVERDGKLITADGPESAAAFANEIINYFK